MNRVLNVFKLFFLIIAFSLSTYICIGMTYRLGNNIFNSILYLIPFVILLILYILNFVFKQVRINDNLFYNVSSIFVFFVIIFVCFRAIFDKGMVLNKVMGYGINFMYFSDFIVFMNFMLYGLILSNLLFMMKRR